jgi:hypothetical protein
MFERIRNWLIQRTANALIKQCHAKGMSLAEYYDSVAYDSSYDEHTKIMTAEQIYAYIGERYYERPVRTA